MNAPSPAMHAWDKLVVLDVRVVITLLGGQMLPTWTLLTPAWGAEREGWRIGENGRRLFLKLKFCHIFL